MIAEMSEVLIEPSYLFDDLLIISGERGRLHQAQRDLIRQGAEALKEAQSDLMKTREKLTAVTEQLTEALKREQALVQQQYPRKLWEMSATIKSHLVLKKGIIDG